MNEDRGSGDEQSLVEAAARGDASAADILLERHLPQLRAFLRLRMGPLIRSHEASTDLAQSVCREVLQHLDRFQYPGEKAFKHWLYTMAMRKLSNRRDFYQADKRDVRRDVSPAAGADDEGDAKLSQIYGTLATPSRELMAREMTEGMERAFDELSEEYRDVIILSRFVGMSRAEVASEMGKSEASVRNLLHRALSRLAEALERQGLGGTP